MFSYAGIDHADHDSPIKYSEYLERNNNSTCEELVYRRIAFSRIDAFRKQQSGSGCVNVMALVLMLYKHLLPIALAWSTNHKTLSTRIGLDSAFYILDLIHIGSLLNLSGAFV